MCAQKKYVQIFAYMQQPTKNEILRFMSVLYEIVYIYKEITCTEKRFSSSSRRRISSESTMIACENETGVVKLMY